MARDIVTTTKIILDAMERLARPEANELLFLLKHLLDGNDLIWEIDALECFGTNADALHEVSDTGVILTAEGLLQLLEGVYQIIDGDFTGKSADDVELSILFGDGLYVEVMATENRIREPQN